jgi:hypothetical protein
MTPGRWRTGPGALAGAWPFNNGWPDHHVLDLGSVGTVRRGGK